MQYQLIHMPKERISVRISCILYGNASRRSKTLRELPIDSFAITNRDVVLHLGLYLEINLKFEKKKKMRLDKKYGWLIRCFVTFNLRI